MKKILLIAWMSTLPFALFAEEPVWDEITGKTWVQGENSQITNSRKDREEIENLIRSVLKWADSNNAIDILPMAMDNDDIYIGFDLGRLRSNLDKLKATGLFSREFIGNYERIILTLDKKLRGGEFEKWPVGELPHFRFANGVNPWCECQDVPYDEPDPWNHIEVEVVELGNEAGEFVWRWGGLGPEMDSGWKEFSYSFRTVKENGKWKVAYLQGFDFEEAI